MKVQRTMTQIAVKRFDKENSLGVSGRDILYLVAVKQPQPDGSKGILRIIAQQLLNRTQFTGMGVAPDSMIFESNDDFVDRAWRRAGDLVRRLQNYAWPGGDRSYCLIL